jgi:hypothetical protein
MGNDQAVVHRERDRRGGRARKGNRGRLFYVFRDVSCAAGLHPAYRRFRSATCRARLAQCTTSSASRESWLRL